MKSFELRRGNWKGFATVNDDSTCSETCDYRMRGIGLGHVWCTLKNDDPSKPEPVTFVWENKRTALCERLAKNATDYNRAKKEGKTK